VPLSFDTPEKKRESVLPADVLAMYWSKSTTPVGKGTGLTIACAVTTGTGIDDERDVAAPEEISHRPHFPWAFPQPRDHPFISQKKTGCGMSSASYSDEISSRRSTEPTKKNP